MRAIKLKNKIYIVLIAIVLIVIAIVAILLINNSTSRVVITNDKEEKVMNTNALTMMYETEAGSGEYQVSSDTTWPQEGYVFNERLSGCENGSELTWDDERKVVILSTTVSDKCYVYFDIEVITLANYIINEVYTGIDGDNGLYYHDGIGSYINADQEAGDNSYRYAGVNPNNYVCFGSDAESCSNDNLYRIIGVFGNQIKLIKHDYAGSDLLGTNGDFYSASYSGLFESSNYYKGSKDQSTIPIYYWNNNTGKNIWSESQLNTVNLNTNYLNNIGSTWSSKIATHTWQVGGNISENIRTATPKTAYTNEIVSPAESTTYESKIGLMYVSDYGYAASPENWTKVLGYLDRTNDYSSTTNTENNWMYMGLYEWTILRVSDVSNLAFDVNLEGFVDDTSNVVEVDGVYGDGHAIRPVFYLNSDVQYISGSGTESDPFRIA